MTALVVTWVVLGSAGASSALAPVLKAVQFPLGSVKLTPGSRLATQRDANIDWLVSLVGLDEII